MKNAVVKIFTVIGIVVICAMPIFAGYLFVTGVMNCQEYSEVYKDPVWVEATVTLHDEYEDSDGDTDYYSYVSYTVDGVYYKNVDFETENTRSDLTPCGTKLRLAVNPRNHAQLLMNLAQPGVVAVTGTAVAATLAAILWVLRRRRLSKEAYLLNDDEVIKKDIKAAISARFFRPLWFFATVMMAALCVLYPMIFGKWFIVYAAVLAVFWVICIIRAIKDMGMCARGEYTIHNDRLVDKHENTDSDGDTTYTLCYAADDREWSTSTTRKKFEKAVIGTVIKAVYLNGRKKPIVHYDDDGANT